MSYRNRTYVIFDGDNDMWAYAYMKGWKESEQLSLTSTMRTTCSR